MIEFNIADPQLSKNSILLTYPIIDNIKLIVVSFYLAFMAIILFYIFKYCNIALHCTVKILLIRTHLA